MTSEMGIKKFIQDSMRLAKFDADNAFARAIGADRQLVSRWLGKSLETRDNPQKKIDPVYMIKIQELTKETDQEFWKRFKRQVQADD